MTLESSDLAPPHRWRVSKPGRVVGVVLTACLFGLGLWMIVGGVLTGELGLAVGFSVLGVVSGLGPGVGALRFVRRARVELTTDVLVVGTTFAEHRIPWAEVEGAHPGYGGVRVSLTGGRVVVAGAVQKSNLSVWLNRRTRADELADEINRRVADPTTGRSMPPARRGSSG